MIRRLPLAMFGLLLALISPPANAQSQMWCDRSIGPGSINCLCGDPVQVELFTTGFPDGFCLGKIRIQCDPGCGYTYAKKDCSLCENGRCDESYCFETELPPERLTSFLQVSERVLVVGCSKRAHLLRELLRAQKPEKVL